MTARSATWRRRTITSMTALALMLIAGAPRAAAQEWIRVIGPKEHVISARRLSGHAEIQIPVRLMDAPRPLRFLVTQVRHVERSEPRPRSAFTFSIRPAALPAHADLIA